MTSLNRALEDFARAHAADLTAADQFELGVAAGIIARVHREVERQLRTDSEIVVTLGDELS